jgi:hypothetical protein
MKIFKGVLIALYAFIVLGSVQNYSSQYNGQEVFSLIVILDNFVITAVLPLIIYGVGRKFFFKKDNPTPVSTPKKISMPKPEIIEKWKKRAFNLLLLLILFFTLDLIIVGVSAYLSD